MARVLIVSNRLPISVIRSEGRLSVTRSAGGLATGLSHVHRQGDSLWIGWPGHSETLTPQEAADLAREYDQNKVRAVSLSQEEVQRYYEEFCNGVLWPLFHYLIGQLPFEVEGLELYETVNRRFAEAVISEHQPGDMIWVHDYQLMLVPQMIRERIPDARVGYFLHTPFPASDVFRTLPFRERLLQGLLGADLIGFHTAAYMRHFASSVLRQLGVPTDVDRMRWDSRTVRLGVFPMGVDAAGFDALARSPELLGQVQALRGQEDVQILVGIDRLDYTKGIPRRLLAFERLLREHPDIHGRVRLIQVAVPSRTNVEAYQEYRNQVDTIIGRIHGAFATPTWVPIHYLFRGLPAHEVAALYRAADVMLVTPIRDGMNLVAKEFVACRADEGGVLVLSEFAGAGSELSEAVHVNPFDIGGMAEAYHRALTMPSDEVRTRMRALRRRVLRFDVQRWSRVFLDTLERATLDPQRQDPPSSEASIRSLAKSMRAAGRLVLLLDYDGTLVPLAPTPELAPPDRELMTLLRALCERPNSQVHLVSGRTREDMARWLGHLPVHLHAEHGLWSRAPGEKGGEAVTLDTSWKERVRPILLDYADRTPGSLVEEKPAGFAWHYRSADPEFGPLQAREMRQHLTELISNTPVEILSGPSFIEIRPHGVNKGHVVTRALAREEGALIVALGDDTTDEEMFAALPAGSISIRVGRGDSRAAFRLPNVPAVRRLLRALVDA